MTRESMLLKEDFYDVHFLRGQALLGQAAPWKSACFGQEAEKVKGRPKIRLCRGFYLKYKVGRGKQLRISCFNNSGGLWPVWMVSSCLVSGLR